MTYPSPTRRPARRSVSVALILALLLAGAPAAANAGPSADPAGGDPIEQLIEAYLAAHPGGVRINETELAYDGGTFIVGVAPSTRVIALLDNYWSRR